MNKAKERAALVERMAKGVCKGCCPEIWGNCQDKRCFSDRISDCSNALAAITETHRIEPMEATEEMLTKATTIYEGKMGCVVHTLIMLESINAALVAGDIGKG